MFGGRVVAYPVMVVRCLHRAKKNCEPPLVIYHTIPANTNKNSARSVAPKTLVQTISVGDRQPQSAAVTKNLTGRGGRGWTLNVLGVGGGGGLNLK